MEENISPPWGRRASASGFTGHERAVPDSFKEAGALSASARWFPELPITTRTYSGDLAATNNLLTAVTPLRDGIIRYRVQRGDTLPSVAARFSISQDTVRWANPLIEKNFLPGTELVILPVSGVLYAVSAGDSLESIATQYHLDLETIRAWNPSYQQILADGGTLVLPNAKPLTSRSLSKSSKSLLPK